MLISNQQRPKDTTNYAAARTTTDTTTTNATTTTTTTLCPKKGSHLMFDSKFGKSGGPIFKICSSIDS